MTKLFLLLITIISGMGVGAQASINAGLGRKVGAFEAALVSFAIGTLLLSLVVIFLGKGSLLQLANVSRWQLTGGVLGAVFVTAIILSVPKIGAAAAVTAGITGQILMSIVIDHYGFFGVQRIPFDWQRLLGVCLLALALYLIFRSSITS